MVLLLRSAPARNRVGLSQSVLTSRSTLFHLGSELCREGLGRSKDNEIPAIETHVAGAQAYFRPIKS